MFEAVRVVLGLVLVLFLPGIALVYALFPARGDLDLKYDWLYRVFLGFGFSVVITILVGFALNMLGVSDDGTGYFTGLNLTLVLVGLTLALLVLAWLRGAFPMLGKAHPLLARDPAVGRYQMAAAMGADERKAGEEIEKLAKRRASLTRRLSRLEGALPAEGMSKERDALLEELKTVNARLEELERGGAVV